MVVIILWIEVVFTFLGTALGSYMLYQVFAEVLLDQIFSEFSVENSLELIKIFDLLDLLHIRRFNANGSDRIMAEFAIHNSHIKSIHRWRPIYQWAWNQLLVIFISSRFVLDDKGFEILWVGSWGQCHVQQVDIMLLEGLVVVLETMLTVKPRRPILLIKRHQQHFINSDIIDLHICRYIIL